MFIGHLSIENPVRICQKKEQVWDGYFRDSSKNTVRVPCGMAETKK